MTEYDLFHAVFVPRDLPPCRAGFRLADVMRKLPAIAIRHRREQPATVFGSLQFDFRDARKVAPGAVLIRLNRRAEFVEIDLLEEVQIRLRLLSLVRIASVENAAAVGQPRRAAAASRILHAGDAVGQMFAGFRAEKMERAILAAILRETDGNEFSIRRRHKPIHRHLPSRLQFVRVEHHALRRQIIHRRQ